MRNAQDGISLVQTAESALNESSLLLQRIRELSVQAANGTLRSTDLTAVSDEVVALRDEINRISPQTEFNGVTHFKAVDGWVWDVGAAQWEESYAVLLAYVAKHGHARVPFPYRTADGYRLGQWSPSSAGRTPAAIFPRSGSRGWRR